MAEGPSGSSERQPRGTRAIKNLAATLDEIASAHPDKTPQLWCGDEAREGRKGRTGHRWFTRGQRPPGRRDKRFLSTDILAAIRPGTDEAFALVPPHANAATMDLFLAEFPAIPPSHAHAVLMRDGAGWHGKAALSVPDNIALLALPPYSPEPNPVERIWLYPRERHLSFRLHQSEEDIVKALCAAWNALCSEAGRLTTLTSYPWIMPAQQQVGI